MAEVIGCAASIIGIAGFGSKLALNLYQLADALGSAGSEARNVASEISVFTQSLFEVSKIIERKNKATSQNMRGIVQTVIMASESLIKDIQVLIEDLGLAQTTKRTTWSTRIKWIMRKPRVLSLRASIESFKSTLILLIATSDTAEAYSRDAPESIMCVM